MSRDLKNEYEAMLDQEIPDLWSRIEPRLAEKKGVQTEYVKQVKRARRRPKRSTIAVCGSLAAAGVCLAIILPAWRGNEKNAGEAYQMSDFNTAADNTASAGQSMGGDMQQSQSSTTDRLEPENNSANDSSAGGYDYAVDYEDGMDGLTKGDGAVCEEGAEIAEDMAACENGSAQEDTGGGMDISAETEANRYGVETGLLSVYECSGEVVDVWRTREGVFYRMIITEGVGDTIPAGEEIVILQKTNPAAGLPGAQNAEMATGNRYRVVLEPEEADGGTRYVLTGYEAED